MDTYIIPPINTEGIYTITEPFWRKEYDTVTMKLTEIRNIQEMVNNNEKVFEIIYEPVGLTREDYERDVNNEVPMLTFSNSKKEHIYIPANRLSAIPNITGTKYQSQILSFNLGLLPVNYDSSRLRENIEDLISSTIGVNATSKVLLNSGIHMISDSDSDKFTKLRASKIKTATNIYGKYNKLFKNYNEVIDYLKLLTEKYMNLRAKLALSGEEDGNMYNDKTKQIPTNTDNIEALKSEIAELEKIINNLKKQLEVALSRNTDGIELDYFESVVYSTNTILELRDSSNTFVYNQSTITAKIGTPIRYTIVTDASSVGLTSSNTAAATAAISNTTLTITPLTTGTTVVILTAAATGKSQATFKLTVNVTA